MSEQKGEKFRQLFEEWRTDRHAGHIRDAEGVESPRLAEFLKTGVDPGPKPWPEQEQEQDRGEIER